MRRSCSRAAFIYTTNANDLSQCYSEHDAYGHSMVCINCMYVME